MTYDKGYFYPGPAVKDVPLSHGAEGEPGRDQGIRPARIRRAGSPSIPHALPLDAKPMVDAFRRWDEQVGAQKTK